MCAVRRLLPAVLVTLCVGNSLAADDSLEVTAQQYFADMYERFEKTVASKYATGTDRAALNQHFVWVMKRFPTMHSFVKTNSKGTVINKVSFGSVPDKVYEDVPNGAWYSHIALNHKAREKVWFDKESGRYYLVWSRPVEAGPNKKFVGVLAVKIDLWDTFHKFGKTTEMPFLAFINGKALYAHDWKRYKDYIARTFEIPGVRKASMRYVTPEMAEANTEAADSDEDDQPVVDPADVADGASGEAAVEEKKGGCGGPVALVIILLLIAIAEGGFIGFLLYRRKQDDLMRSIDHG